jgi:hypothetical protein
MTRLLRSDSVSVLGYPTSARYYTRIKAGQRAFCPAWATSFLLPNADFSSIMSKITTVSLEDDLTDLAPRYRRRLKVVVGLVILHALTCTCRKTRPRIKVARLCVGKKLAHSNIARPRSRGNVQRENRICWRWRDSFREGFFALPVFYSHRHKDILTPGADWRVASRAHLWCTMFD